jgi:PHD/YefM family antitoxin component YafN of YafNO toxin-antitoxin module
MQREQEAQNMDDDTEKIKEFEEEDKYQCIKLRYQKDFGLISQEEYDKIMEEKKKAKNL